MTYGLDYILGDHRSLLDAGGSMLSRANLLPFPTACYCNDWELEDCCCPDLIGALTADSSIFWAGATMRWTRPGVTSRAKITSMPDKSNTPNPGTHEPIPEYIAHYRILRRLGKGGMGEVFLGEDTRQHSRKVALKVLPKELLKD